jgi:hypothetical protein
MNVNQVKQIIDILLRDPVTQDDLVIISPLKLDDGFNSYKATNPETEAVFKISFKIEEIVPSSEPPA